MKISENIFPCTPLIFLSKNIINVFNYNQELLVILITNFQNTLHLSKIVIYVAVILYRIKFLHLL